MTHPNPGRFRRLLAALADYFLVLLAVPVCQILVSVFRKPGSLLPGFPGEFVISYKFMSLILYACAAKNLCLVSLPAV